ncbi:hypothetical protein SLS56_009706 [Neofusicoccum ribis]|uniref:Peptidase M43 pregnancy-associated plasma-A domain-containing protein n=1 Tax=Neofusicoccum ribis TaxID=45134 RepID=A0ABR3SGI9_9PEZI
MHVKTSFSVGLSAMLGAVNAAGPRCSTSDPPAEFFEKSLEMNAREKAIKQAGILRARAPITVNTWFHVVAASDAVEDANISVLPTPSVNLRGAYRMKDEVLQQQLEVLNSNFAPHDIQFNLSGTTRTINSTWSDNTDTLVMKESLRKGDYATLNLYFQRKTLPGGSSGYCTFPGIVEEGTIDFFNDGCVIDAQTTPGGSAAPYNEGKTSTHEVGHWFGLYHTFQGGCNGSDNIDDTPAQASYSSGCPIGRDSCPDLPGLDPIHNYMDYSDE